MRSLATMLLLACAIDALESRPIYARQSADSVKVVLRGSVRDSATGAPVVGASVRVSASAMSITDDHGGFALEVGRGRSVTLHVTRLGYDSLSVGISEPSTDSVTIALHRAVQTLDTVAVATRATSWSAKLEGFEHRLARQNGGTFYTRQDIEQRRPLVVSDLVRRAPGVRVVDSMGVRLFASARGNKIVDGPRGRRSVPCIMRVGVDGRVMEWGFAADQVAPDEIYGVEVYSGPATIPREYASQIVDSYCGLVMIWTR